MLRIAANQPGEGEEPALLIEYLGIGGLVQYNRIYLERLILASQGTLEIVSYLRCALPSDPLQGATDNELSQCVELLKGGLGRHRLLRESAPPAHVAPLAPRLTPTAIAGIGDLQRAGPAALAAAKARMDVVYDANKTKPGDAGFEYDKREDFTQVAASEWDD